MKILLIIISIGFFSGCGIKTTQSITKPTFLDTAYITEFVPVYYTEDCDSVERHYQALLKTSIEQKNNCINDLISLKKKEDTHMQKSFIHIGSNNKKKHTEEIKLMADSIENLNLRITDLRLQNTKLYSENKDKSKEKVKDRTDNSVKTKTSSNNWVLILLLIIIAYIAGEFKLVSRFFKKRF